MIVTAGSTNVSVYFYIVQDASATSPGEPVTGLLFSDIETGGSASYVRQGALRTDLTLITLASASAAHADGGFILVNDTNMPGLYRCDYPDAAFATGIDQVMLQIVVASGKNAVASPIFVEITDVDLRDNVRGGMTALPNAAADAAGGLPISDAGGLDLDDLPTTAEFNARTLVAASYFDPAADTVATVTTTTNVTNQVTADVTAISGDAPAADNLEAMYDGTGYIDDTAPASRAQVDGIGTASGTALTIAVSEDNASTPIKGVSSVGTETGTFANTEANDGVYHVITHVTNDIDWIYGFDIGGGRTASSVIFKGFLNSNNDAMLLQAFDFVGSDWETIAKLPGQNGSVNITLDPSLLLKHTGTGADLGKVFLRFEADGAMTSPVLNVDLLTVSAVNIGQSIGYASGQIWVDTLDGTAGTEVFVNGVADNAVLTWVDALTLSSSVGITDFHIINGSTAQLTANSDNFSLFGDNWTLDLNGQSTIDAHFEGATISGIQTGARCGIVSGEIGIVTLGTDAHVDFAALTDVITLPTGNITFDQCHMKGTTGPTFDFGAAVGSTTAHIHHYAGLLNIDNLGQLGTDIVNLDGKGKVTIKATCVGGTINLRGNWEVNDLAGGAVTVVQDDLSTDAEAVLVDTAEIGTAGVGLTDLGGMSTAMKAEILVEVQKLLTTQMTESYAADGTAPTLAQALMLIQQSLHEFAIVSTTRTVKKLDGSATAATFTLDDSVNPTSTTRTT